MGLGGVYAPVESGPACKLGCNRILPPEDERQQPH